MGDLVAAAVKRRRQLWQEALGATPHLGPAEGVCQSDPHRSGSLRARAPPERSPMPTASVIVPARNAELTLPRTLRALAGQDLDGGYEVIVVDDGSRDRTAELAERAASGAGAPVTVLHQPPLGPAAARNRGAAYAHAATLAFCDADVFPAPGWLRAGVGALGNADLVQGCVWPDPEAPLGPFDRTLWITSQVGLWETANLFVTRAVFDAAGGFEEWLRPRRGKALAEDVWFGYRALRDGARPAFCPDALAHHAVFERRWTAYAAERARLRYFPAMVARMPELPTRLPAPRGVPQRAHRQARPRAGRRSASTWAPLRRVAGVRGCGRGALHARASPPRRPDTRGPAGRGSGGGGRRGGRSGGAGRAAVRQCSPPYPRGLRIQVKARAGSGPAPPARGRRTGSRRSRRPRGRASCLRNPRQYGRVGDTLTSGEQQLGQRVGQSARPA